MKICVVQARSASGDIQSNIAHHKELIELAVADGADIAIFPELSLTGYEPALAKALATTQDDDRLDDFQEISDARQITIGVGLPIKNGADVCIGMVLFQPHITRETYLKQYIHPDEEAFFVAGRRCSCLIGNSMALAICYELSVPEHAENAYRNGADIYIASAVKSVKGIDKAVQRLSEIADKYSMTVLLSNAVGQADGEVCAGKTAVWNHQGRLAGQLDSTHEGILVIDTETQAIIAKTI